jgi:hypothetical protein
MLSYSIMYDMTTARISPRRRTGVDGDFEDTGMCC